MAEHFDFLIVGAGISGIGAASHLRQRFADASLAVLEAMEGVGGTWWTHRYPGARSDSDLFTYGYGFKPWRGRAIATAGEIRDYLEQVVEENGLAPLIRHGHKVQAAHWSNEDRCWTLQVSRAGSQEVQTFTTSFLWLCAGYYDHGQGYTPAWPTLKDFRGQVVHPQHWPQDLDCAGKRVVVIGSGATAATLIPSLADGVAHVTMLQRSPTFFATEPWEHPLEAQLRPLDLPEEWFHEILRRAFIAKTDAVVRMSFSYPEELRALLIGEARARLPEGFDVDRHFNPRYRPWQQRIANVPDGDLFQAIRSGKASVVTDTIERFDEHGIQLTGGERLDADIIVTATGFHMKLFGGIPFSVDGAPVDWRERVTYRGMMIEGIPNMAYTQGYFRSSWTLRSDLVCDWVCRLIAHMREQGHRVVQPTVPGADAGMQRLPWVDGDNFNAGYVMRAQAAMYGQGDRHPWRHDLEHAEERVALPAASPQDEALAYR
ncbi:FAD-containing monooxygenase EthA [Delftia tsuruhatensis]|uniref:flavin-containing monooxygenase n=1 Tax=Delftia tsuruhatensis TaxID=180282 RepID=UPI001E7F5C7F|nr:NAD(P)/FAD-dependent oxidoreductase [Delftia tsuruhatensis]CAB5716071.1 FAD-containing monooxygenase EthA [Delftia tsuruhatensis]CAC9681257.1 FAD-containing monooxygenase EthA [Delftia tsuruhatensis]